MKNFLKKKNLKNQKKGFTIIETFVGITVLLLGIVGPLVLVNRNLQAARFSRNQITAYYLAQEAIETVRQVRDSNLIRIYNGGTGVQWLTGIEGCTNGCVIEGGASGSITRCSDVVSGGNYCSSRKRLNVSGGRYSHSGAGVSSDFSRYVVIETVGDTNRRNLRVIVEFDTGRYVQQYETTSQLTNWEPKND